MKILIIGFLIFSGWSVLATRIYVCNIKGLCNEQVTMQIEASDINDVLTADTLNKSTAKPVLEIPGNRIIYFAFDKSEYMPVEVMDKYSVDSKAFIDQNLEAKLSITGYTDSVGTDEYNMELGYRRARSMQNYFEVRGISANKIIIESKGEKEPADDNNTTSGRSNNRRTVITIKK